MTRNYCYLFAILQFVVSVGFAQRSEISSSESNFTIVPKSPEASRYEVFGNLQVNHSSGVARVSVPIYKIELRDFAWDISLAYNGRGVKVDDMASNVGLGWNLNVNGLISATVLEKSDIKTPHENDPTILKRHLDFSAGQTANCSYNNTYDVFAIAEAAIDGFRNLIPDIFSINIGRINTKMFLINDVGYTMPASNNKVLLTRNTSEALNRFTVVDDKGHSYYLSFRGKNTRSSVCIGRDRAIDPSPVFYLDSIVTFFGERIKFKYRTTPLMYTYFNTRKQIIAEKMLTNDQNTAYSPCNTHFDILSYNSICENRFSATEPVLEQIEVSNGTTIGLTYASRLDLPASQALRSLTITYQGILFKTFILDNSGYFGTGNDANNLRLKLAGLSEHDEAGKVIGKYSFQYNNTELPGRLSYSIDWDGYYNLANNSCLIPQIPCGANRQANLSAMQAAVLQKVTYPSGGSTAFEYEASPLVGGGLRIKKIFDVTDAGTANTRVFNYGPGGTGGCPDNVEPDVAYFYYTTETTTGNWFVDFAACEFNKYHSTKFCLPFAFLYDPEPFYTYVEELFGVNGENGKKVFKFRWQNPNLGLTNLPVELYEEETYQKTAGGFSIIGRRKYTYEFKTFGGLGIFDDVPTASKEKRLWGKEIVKVHGEIDDAVIGFGTINCTIAQYRQEPLRYASIPYYLKKTEDWQFGSNGTVQLYSSVLFEYHNDSHGYATRVEATKSSGDQLVTINNYIGDYNANSGFIQTLLGRNRVSELIETVSVNLTKNVVTEGQVNSFFLNGNKHETLELSMRGGAGVPFSTFRFSNVSNQGVFPSQQLQKSAFNYDARYYEAKQTVSAYGMAGAPLEMAERSGLTTSVRWDKLWQSVIAVCSGCRSTEFFYEGFDGQGSIMSNTTSKRMGIGGYNGTLHLSNYFSGVSTGRTFVLSYEKFVADKWVSIFEPYTGQTITGLVDEVRIFPSGAQLQTFFYKPQIGITASMDANGRITFYDYDKAGRLKAVLDNSRNIISAYHYQIKSAD